MGFGGLVLPASGQAVALSCLVSPGGAVPSPSQLRFGIYPGGGAGSVNPKAPSRPEDPVRRLASLQTLAGSNPFVVRLYTAWTGVAAADDVATWLDAEIAGYAAAGLQIELVVRYKPVAAGGSAPAAFADYVRGIVRRYGPDERFVSLQVTNEANMPGAPDASDGAFPGAAQALVDGVVAAKDQVRHGGLDHVRIGFSWAYDERPLASAEFWATLGRLGGSAFADAVDWVGLDTYPGTWGVQIAVSNLLPGLAAGAVRESVRSLRDCLMPMAGLGGATTIHIAENGFPTGPGRSEEMQAQTLDAMVSSVVAIRGTYGVSDYRWFDLRDSSSADPSIESQYGITRDDYTPKPAFTAYRDLIASHRADDPGSIATTPAAAPANCTPSPLTVAVPKVKKSRRLSSLVVRVGTKVVKHVRRSKMPRSVRISVRSGRAAVNVRLTSRSGAKRITRVSRSTYRVC